MSAAALAREGGRLLLLIALAAFGVEHIVFAGSAARVMYPWMLGPPAWNYAFGAVLVASSMSIGFGKKAPRTAGTLGAVLCVYALALYVPLFVAHLHDPGPWTDVFALGSPISAACELLAMGGAAWVLAGDDAWIARWGRLLFAGPMIVFGLQHFLYRDFLATLIPSWIPGHLFWENVVGAAFLAAAAGIATGKAGRLAALLLGTMFLLIVLVLHAPRVAAAAGSRDEWTSALVAVAMCGGAFVLAGASSPAERP